jgi:hypothetical protein
MTVKRSYAPVTGREEVEGRPKPAQQAKSAIMLAQTAQTQRQLETDVKPPSVNARMVKT